MLTGIRQQPGALKTKKQIKNKGEVYLFYIYGSYIHC